MKSNNQQRIILIAEDDEDDYLLLSEAFTEYCPLAARCPGGAGFDNCKSTG